MRSRGSVKGEEREQLGKSWGEKEQVEWYNVISLRAQLCLGLARVSYIVGLAFYSCHNSTGHLSYAFLETAAND